MPNRTLSGTLRLALASVHGRRRTTTDRVSSESHQAAVTNRRGKAASAQPCHIRARPRHTGTILTVTDTNNRTCGPLGRFIRTFYDARRAASRTGDLNSLELFIATDVLWSEPDVGAHMGMLKGRDAVVDMIRRALDTTGGTFDLRVTSTVETDSHVAATIAWAATTGGHRIEGQELAVFRVRHGCIAAAWFHPGNVADDQAFWGENEYDR